MLLVIKELGTLHYIVNKKLLKDGAAFITKQLVEEGKKQLGA